MIELSAKVGDRFIDECSVFLSVAIFLPVPSRNSKRCSAYDRPHTPFDRAGYVLSQVTLIVLPKIIVLISIESSHPSIVTKYFLVRQLLSSHGFRDYRSNKVRVGY